MTMKRVLFIFWASLLCIASVWAAGEVSFTASAPQTVISGQPFQLSYTVNASGAKDLRAPELVNFEILAGPYESRSSSTQWVNGKRTSSVSHTFTYTLLASTAGEFTIPSASITVKRDKYTSNGLKVKVLPPDETPAQSGGQGKTNAQGSVSASDGSISAENLFVRALISKTKVYEQECISLTYKLYTLVDVTQLASAKVPDFAGFLKQEVERKDNTQMAYEHYKGRNYATFVLHESLLYPQHSGELEIDKAQFEVVVRVQNRAQVRSIFDNFFDSYSNVNKMLTAPAIKVHVKDLPATTSTNYTGGVGQFSITSDITDTQVDANEAVTLKLKIKGKGNMKLVKAPEVAFPEGFEVYSPKTSNDFKTTSAGVSGTKTIEYLFIPRVAGNYTIPSVTMTYFDPKTSTYKELSTVPYTLHVEKGEGGESTQVIGNTYVPQEDIKKLGQDIRYIYTGEIEPNVNQKLLFGTLLFWLIFLVPLLVSVFLFVFFRNQIKERADIAKMKHKKANQIAQRRLKQAQKYWKKGENALFYDEILRVLWTYMSDKLSMPVAQLNKENIADELLHHEVAAEQIANFMELLNTCEFARYAPAVSEDPMGDLYQKVVDVISDLESGIKKRKN